MKNRERIEWLRMVLKDLEQDAKNGQNVACAVLSVQAAIITLLEAELEDRKAA